MTGIKKETLRKIALVACTKRNISRDALAEELGISSMTVGKAARALVDSGMLREARDPVSRGRHATLLSPSEKFVYLFIFMSCERITLVAENLTKSEIHPLDRAIDPALTCKENISTAVRELFERNELENRIAGSAVVLLSPKEELNGFDLTKELIFDSDTLARDAIARDLPRENVLYINISGGVMRPLIVSRGNAFYRDGAKETLCGSQSDMAHKIAHLVSSVSVYSCPHRVILEGDAGEENELIFLVKDELARISGIPKSAFPVFEYFGGLSLMREALFDILRETHIDLLCDSLFVEQ